MSKTIRVPCRPSFDLGQIVVTPGALAATTEEQRRYYPTRHSIGDWGQACREESDANDEAVRRLRREHALDHHRGRPERDHVPVAGRVLTEAEACRSRATGLSAVSIRGLSRAKKSGFTIP